MKRSPKTASIAAPLLYGTMTRRPAFPVAALPEWLGAYVQDVARFTQTPPDLPGVLALTAFAGAVAGKLSLEVVGGYIEPLNLFALIALPSAERKSAVTREMYAPYEEEESALQQAWREEMKRQRSDDDDEPSEGRPMPRLMADDVTPEKLASLMSEQRGRMTVASAEGSIIDIATGKYSGTPNLDVLLRGHSGDPMRFDRINRPSVFVPVPRLTLALAVQPDVIRALGVNRVLRARGLPARFLFSLPHSLVGQRAIGEPPISAELREKYQRRIRQLLQFGDSEPGEILLTLSRGARREWEEHAARIEPRLDPERGDLSSIGDWAGKLPGATARLAGVLHVATYGTKPNANEVSATTMADAVLLADYFLEHALVAFDVIGVLDIEEDAQAIVTWLLGRPDVLQFTARDVQRAHPRRFRRVGQVREAAAVLDEREFVRHDSSTGIYVVNPRLRLARADKADARRAR